jgi:hypothetical protein
MPFEKLLRKRRKSTSDDKPTFAVSTSTTEPSGGYSITPQDGIEYIKPQFLKGQTVLDNVSVAGKLWGNNPWITELKFLTRVPFIETVPHTDQPVDKQLSEAMAPAEGNVKQSPRRLSPEDSLFNAWRDYRQEKQKIGLIDKRLDERRTDIGDIGKIEIISLPISTTPLCSTKISVGNQEALSFAISNSAMGQSITVTDEYVKTTSNLSFPRLPQLEPSRTSRREYRGTKTGGVEIESLLRPKDAKNSNKPIRKVKSVETKSTGTESVKIPTPRVTTADIAGVWKL